MKISKRLGAIGTLAITFFASCESDFDLNAPYEITPVVYGFVEPDVDTQYVKITKSFIGEGNNAAYASINDSLLFQNVSGEVHKIENGNVMESYPLQEKWVGNLEPGIFFTDSQKVYYWMAPVIEVPLPGGDIDTNYLEEDVTYQLDLTLNEGEYIVTAESEIVGDVGFGQVFKNQLFASGASFANTSAPGDNVYNDVNISWTSANNGERYEVQLVFNYLEEWTDGSSYLRSISTSLGSQTESGDNLRVYNGESFYAFVDSRLQNDPNESMIEKRRPIGVEFHLTVADENLHTYMTVNEPSSGIVTEKPVFTNINGGIGLFSSRRQEILAYKNANLDPYPLSLNSEKELVFGQYTNQYRFCSQTYTDPLVICN